LAIENRLACVVVKRRSGLFEWNRFKRVRLCKHGGVRFYHISDAHSIADGIALLNGLPFWHAYHFHLLIGPRELPEALAASVPRRRLIPRLRLWSWDPARDIERSVERLIVCTIEPLDNELRFYGESPICAIFRSSLLPVSSTE